VVSVSDVSSRDGLETYQRLVSVSSRLRAVSVSVSSRNSLAMSRSRLGLGTERLGLGLGLEGLVHIPACRRRASVNGCHRFLILIFLCSHIKMLMSLPEFCHSGSYCAKCYGRCNTAFSYDELAGACPVTSRSQSSGSFDYTYR
jgi:hypothetical protein